jgi:hypothetical protein
LFERRVETFCDKFGNDFGGIFQIFVFGFFQIIERATRVLVITFECGNCVNGWDFEEIER